MKIRRKSTASLLPQQHIGIINLGCARNLVDSQNLLGRLKNKGHKIVNINEADIAIINTCSFIEAAKKETIDTILSVVELKKKGQIRKIIVAGCFAQRYGEELLEEIKEVDALLGVPIYKKDFIPQPLLLTPPYSAYVKICESCYNQCHFCAIPLIKGKFSSRTIESILAEIRQLDQQGVKEINIIGQDITAYGIDIYQKKSLAELIKRILKEIKSIEWIRLLYMFPSHVTEELLDVIASDVRICQYIDLPLQHINDHLLEKMNRGFSKKQTIDLIKLIRKKIPEASLRTTFIVGFPGETDKHFMELLAFIKEMRFHKVGAFKYSREEGTLAYHFSHQVSATKKNKRFDQLMRTQQKISRNIQHDFIGKTIKVLIDQKEPKQKNVYLGRSKHDAPEVDGMVFVNSKKELLPGDFVSVKIKDALEYDLIGELTIERSKGEFVDEST